MNMQTLQRPDDSMLRTLALATGVLLGSHNERFATAESCTGGWLGKLCTDIPGSSAWFSGAVVAYANDIKHALLGVAESTFHRHGAVSRECALEMAAGALLRLDATLAVAVTGIAGPTGGTPDKPVGTVWIAWQRRGATARAEAFHFVGDRDAVRRQAVAAALEGVRKILTA